MKKVLAFIGSPRKLGNSEIIVKEISRGISLPHELRMLRLSDFDIKPCRGCYACLFGDGGCPIRDDFNSIVEEILATDAYIVASPTYFLGTTSVFKLLIDRWLALLPYAERLWAKPGIAVGVAGIEHRQGSTELGLESFLKLLLADLKGVGMVFGALPGEILYNDHNREVLVRLAAALFGERSKSEGPACPVCSGTTFRFLGGGSVRCMLCSNTGTCATQEDGVVFKIRPGEHELFTSLEASIEHREWLKGMKGRFVNERPRLKALTIPFLGEGTWVKPGPA